MKQSWSFVFLLFFLSTFMASCFKDVDSSSQFIFKPAPRTGLVANVAGNEITEEETLKGIKGDIYQLEKKIYDLKYGNLKAIMLKELVKKNPKAKGLSDAAFLEKEVFSNIKPSKKQVDAFIKERNIPKDHVNDQLKERVKVFLMKDLKEKATDNWLAQQSQSNKIEIYLTRPERPFFDVQLGEAPVMGGKNPKVTIVEFSDFECPYCKKGAEVVSEIKKKFGDKVRVAFKHFPATFSPEGKRCSSCIHVCL